MRALHHLADESLAGLVLRVRFARVQNLQSACLLRDAHQALGIGEHQARALIGGHAARKPQRQNVGIQHQARAGTYLGQQLFLGARMRRADHRNRDVDGVAQEKIVAPPCRNLLSSICCTCSDSQVGACTPLVMASMGNSGNISRDTFAVLHGNTVREP